MSAERIRRYLSTREMVEKINMFSLDWFYDHRAAMEALGFPKPVPKISSVRLPAPVPKINSRQPHRYDPLAIEAWQNRMLQECAPELVMQGNAPAEEDWTRKLEQRLAPAGHA